MSDVIDPPVREIPVIDVAPFRDGTARAAVAEAVAQACESIGFFVITGHGIAPETLNRLIAEPGFGDTAVIVNEFGEAGVDGALVARADERAFAMSVGCLCCTVSGDVRLGLLRLLDEADRGVGPAFSRVVIETTGLADPAPLLQTFMTGDEMLQRFTLNGVVTLVAASPKRATASPPCTAS
ncbi:MAG: GTP-binding protein, partial [Pseudomonadota bacterium]